jgi:hypothetical protein
LQHAAGNLAGQLFRPEPWGGAVLELADQILKQRPDAL